MATHTYSRSGESLEAACERIEKALQVELAAARSTHERAMAFAGAYGSYHGLLRLWCNSEADALTASQRFIAMTLRYCDDHPDRDRAPGRAGG